MRCDATRDGAGSRVQASRPHEVGEHDDGEGSDVLGVHDLAVYGALSTTYIVSKGVLYILHNYCSVRKCCFASISVGAISAV